MSATRNQVSYGAGSTSTASLNIISQVISTMTSAGYVEMRTTTDGFGHLFRFPSLDRYHSHSDLLYISNLTGTSVNFWSVQDWDPQTAADPTGFQGPTGAPGQFNANFPLGPPTITVLGNSGQTTQLSPTAAAFTCTTYASEHGVIVVYDNGVSSNFSVVVLSRPLSSFRHPRRLRLQTGGVVGPISLSAPTGPAHLTFDVDGNPLSVVFPSGALTASRIAQEVTIQTGGTIEGHLDSDGSIIFESPYDSEPVFGTSNVAPRLGLTYVDPTADGLDLSTYLGSFNSVNTSTLSLHGAEWVLQGVKIGATVLNRTRGTSATISGFSSALSQSDTLTGTFSMNWAASDTYVVLPGPQSWAHGLDGYSGHQQSCPVVSSSVKTHADGSIQYVLNDLLGEARGSYSVGQSVLVCSNGMAPTFTVASTAGFVVGDTITDTTTGATGILRAIYPGTSELTIDTVSPPSGRNQPAFANLHTVSGTKGGSSAISFVRSSTFDTTRGWYQRVPITAVGTKSVATGDYRTTLTLDLSGMTANARLGPCVVISTLGRMISRVQWTGGGTDPPTIQTNQQSPTMHMDTDTDVARVDQLLLTSGAPRWDPDWETGSLVLGEVVFRFSNGLNTLCNDVTYTLPHFRSVSARNGAFANGDAVDENGDLGRRWRVLHTATQSSSYGAGETGSTSHFWAIGPGAL